MFEKLKLLQKRSYAPYSYFRVSAILVTNDNKEFYGVNVENNNGNSLFANEYTNVIYALGDGVSLTATSTGNINKVKTGTENSTNTFEYITFPELLLKIFGFKFRIDL